MKFLHAYRIVGLCIALTASSYVALSQNPQAPEGRGNPGQSTTQPRSTPGQSSTSPQTDRDRANIPSNTAASSSSFVGKAIEINSAEVQLGQLAAKKATNERVKSFAQMMV